MADIPPRPVALPVNFDNIPGEPKLLDHWILWRYTWNEERGIWDKPPYQANGELASSTAKHTWSSYTKVKALYEHGLTLPTDSPYRYDGVGFVPAAVGNLELNLQFGDLDKCRDKETGQLSSEAMEDLDSINSYAEVSPSGTGIRFIAKGAPPYPAGKHGCKTGGYEIYEKAHYLTITGNRLEGYPATVEKRPEELNVFFAKHFSESDSGGPSDNPHTEGVEELTDDEIIALAAEAKNSDKFMTLMSGEWESVVGAEGKQLYPTRSEGDQALCNLIAFYTTSHTQIDRIFRRSKLYRGKWDEARGSKTYGENTIWKAINDCREHYTGDGPKEAPPAPGPTTITDCSLIELGIIFIKWLYIKEAYNLTSFFAGVIANFCDGSPDILGIIGPSGSTKTELIRSLGEKANSYVYPVSTITQHTLVSGHKDSKDLVPQLKGRILTIKDLTSILSTKEDVRAAIFADFRELTDEYIRKEFGNGIAKEYGGIHSSIIFASTTAIERYYSMYSNLGQRMIFFRPQNDPKKARERARQNRDKQKLMRDELHDVAMRFITSMLKIKDEKGLPTTPDIIAEEMGELFDFLAIARTPIHHDYRTGDIDELPEPEFPTRITNTVGRLMEVHALMNGREEVDYIDMAFGCRIISDNIPSMRWKILKALTTEWQHAAKIAQVEDLTIGAVKYHVDELVALKLVKKLLKDEVDPSMDRRFDYYKLSEIAADAIEKYNTRVRGEGNSKDELTKLIEINNISLSNPCTVSKEEQSKPQHSKPVVDEGESAPSSPTLGPHPRKEDPEIARLRAGHASYRVKHDKHTCSRCGKHDDIPYIMHDYNGYYCEACRRGDTPQEPSKPDPQRKLPETAEA